MQLAHHGATARALKILLWTTHLIFSKKRCSWEDVCLGKLHVLLLLSLLLSTQVALNFCCFLWTITESNCQLLARLPNGQRNQQRTSTLGSDTRCRCRRALLQQLQQPPRRWAEERPRHQPPKGPCGARVLTSYLSLSVTWFYQIISIMSHLKYFHITPPSMFNLSWQPFSFHSSCLNKSIPSMVWAKSRPRTSIN